MCVGSHSYIQTYVFSYTCTYSCISATRFACTTLRFSKFNFIYLSTKETQKNSKPTHSLDLASRALRQNWTCVQCASVCCTNHTLFALYFHVIHTHIYIHIYVYRHPFAGCQSSRSTKYVSTSEKFSQWHLPLEGAHPQYHALFSHSVMG